MRLEVPKTAGHEAPFYPQALERGRRSCRAVMLAVAEMYIKGVSTRDAEAVMASSAWRACRQHKPAVKGMAPGFREGGVVPPVLSVIGISAAGCSVFPVRSPRPMETLVARMRGGLYRFR